MVRLIYEGQEKICRVQSISISKNREDIEFKEHWDTGTKQKKRIRFSADALKDADLQLLEINPIGKVISTKIIA